MRLIRLILACVAATILFGVHQSRALDASPAPRVTFDMENYTFDRQLPHGKNFDLDIRVPKSIDKVRWTLWKRSGKNCNTPRQSRPYTARLQAEDDTTRLFRVRMQALNFSVRYCFAISAAQKWSEEVESTIKATLSSVPLTLSRNSKGVSDFTAAQIKQVLSQQLPDLKDHSVVVTDRNRRQTKIKFLDMVADWAEQNESFKQVSSVAESVLSAREELRQYYDQIQDLDINLDMSQNLSAGNVDISQLGSYKGSRESRAKLLVEMESVITALESNTGSVSTDQLEDLKNLTLGLQARLDLLQNIASCMSSDFGVEDLVLQKKMKRFCRRTTLLLNQARLSQQLLDNTILKYSTFRQAYASYREEVNKIVVFWRSDMQTYQPLGGFGTIEGGTRQDSLYFGGDVGFLMVAFMDTNGRMWDQDVAVYAGAALHFSPVDDSVPLSVDGRFSQRFSLIIGITVDEPQDEDQTISGPLFRKCPIGGFGFRITDHLRLGGGVLLYQQRNRNPLVDSKGLRAAPYLSLSVNLKGAKLIGAKVKEGTELFEQR